MTTVYPNPSNTMPFNEWAAYIKREAMKQYSTNSSKIHKKNNSTNEQED